jgi:hypothetical protein
MPAFGFRPQFAAPIVARTKAHTIRAAVPRGYTVGHWAPLYTGLRTKAVQLIGSGKMATPSEVRIDFDQAAVQRNGAAQETLAFARADGFPTWEAMEAFWTEHHPGVRQFSGWLLPWTEFTLEHRLGGA